MSVGKTRIRVVTPLYFASPGEWRKWLTGHHKKDPELWVGFHKRGTGRPSLSWPESVDEALCYGWIDGVRKRVDGERYVIRFTPRQPGSTWSLVNIKRVRELTRAGRMRAAGSIAFRKRTAKKSGIYSYEQRGTATLRRRDEAAFKATPAAWQYFSSRPPWYRRVASYWVVSPKKEATRQRRLGVLIACSAAGQPIGPLTRP